MLLYVVSLCVVAAAVVAATSPNLEEGRALQAQIDHSSEELHREMLALELAYHRKKVPLINERNALLKTIPGFWKRVIETHPSHQMWIRGTDADVLTFLEDIQIKELEEDVGEHHSPLHTFRLELHFRTNDYFAQTVLWREMRGSLQEEVVSGVSWLPGMQPSYQGGSFFNFFEKREHSPLYQIDDHTLNEIFHVFRYEFWINPFTYFDMPSYADYASQAASYEHDEM